MIKDNIYYIVIDNEVYECKIEHLLASVSNVRFRDFINNQFSVNTIVLNIAGIGYKKWVRYGYSNDFNITQIYYSVENAMRKSNNIFNFSRCSATGIHKLWEEKSLPEIEGGFFVNELDSLGCECVYARCYVWDGLEVKRVQVESPAHNSLIFANSYKALQFDFAQEEYIYDEKQGNRYITAERCAKFNSVKVHRFC